jgi:hypothetical protein
MEPTFRISQITQSCIFFGGQGQARRIMVMVQFAGEPVGGAHNTRKLGEPHPRVAVGIKKMK